MEMGIEKRAKKKLGDQLGAEWELRTGRGGVERREDIFKICFERSSYILVYNSDLHI